GFQQLTGGGRNQMGEVGERNFGSRDGIARSRGGRGPGTFYQRVERQRIEFSDKAHRFNLTNPANMSSCGNFFEENREAGSQESQVRRLSPGFLTSCFP